MEIVLDRRKCGSRYTLGEMRIVGMVEVYPTVEDVVRVGGEKVYGETAIPAGRYRVVLDVVSPKFSKYAFYRDVCGGRLPRLLGVPNFEGVLIHCGRTELNTNGCILLNEYGGSLEYSKELFSRFYGVLCRSDEEIYITIR